MYICPKCQAQLPDDAKFCTFCGSKREASEQVAPEQTASQQEERQIPQQQVQPQQQVPPQQMQQQQMVQQMPQQQVPQQQAQYQQVPPQQMQPQQPYQGGGFVPPNGQGYAHPASAAQPAPKKKSMLPLIIIAAVVALAVVIGVVVLITRIFSGSDSDKANDPNLGEWKAVSAESNGQSVDVKESFGGDFIFDLKKGGKVEITMGDQEAKAKWTLDGEKFTVKGAGLNSTGTLKNGVLKVDNILDSGISATFEKVGGYQGATSGISTGGGTTALPGGSSTDPAGNASGAVYYILDVEATAGMKEMVEAAGEESANMGYELLPDGTCYYYMATVKMAGEIKDGAFVPKYQRDGFSTDGKVTVDGDTLTMDENGFKMFFKRVDEKPAFMNDAMDLDEITAATEPDQPPDGDGMENEFESPTKQITYPSHWYGYVRFFDFKGVEPDVKIQDVWAYFGKEQNGTFVDIYKNADYIEKGGDTILSMYVEENKYGLMPIIGHEDAWLYDMYLLPEEAWQFECDLYNGALTFTAEYFGKNGSCKVQFYLREQGTPWDVDNEILPPNYDKYH